MEENFDIEMLDENQNDFIEPAKNEEIARQQIINSLLQSKENFSYVNFAKLVISYNLKHLNIEEGINFKTFSSPADKNGFILGAYSEMDNSISFNLGIKANPLLLINTLAHESMHKSQHDKNLTSKLLSGKENEHYIFSHSSERFYNLCGFDKKFAYALDKAETEAFSYGFETAINFKNEALRHYDKGDEDFDETTLQEPDRKIYEGLKEQYQPVYQALMNRDLLVDFSTNKLKKEIINYTKNGVDLFNSCLNKAKNTDEQLSQLTEDQNTIRDILFGKRTEYILKLANIAGHIPQRELVSNLVDFAISSLNPSTFNMCLNEMLGERVPFTLSDAYKLFMQTESFADTMKLYIPSESSKILEDNSICEIDELALAKLLVVTHGKDDAKNRIDEIRKFNDQMELTEDCGVSCAIQMDTNKTLEEIAKHSAQPVYKTEEGVSLYGSKDVLDYALDKHCKENNIEINSPQYIQAKLELTNNLACVISHFENPYPENEEYLDAISTFVKTPTFNQYEFEEDFSERPTCFTDEANDMIEESIKRLNNGEEIQTKEELAQAKSDLLASKILTDIFGTNMFEKQDNQFEDDDLPEE